MPGERSIHGASQSSEMLVRSKGKDWERRYCTIEILISRVPINIMIYKPPSPFVLEVMIVMIVMKCGLNDYVGATPEPVVTDDSLVALDCGVQGPHAMTS